MKLLIFLLEWYYEPSSRVADDGFWASSEMLVGGPVIDWGEGLSALSADFGSGWTTHRMSVFWGEASLNLIEVEEVK